MALLYGRAGRLTAKNGGFRPGQIGGISIRMEQTYLWSAAMPCALSLHTRRVTVRRGVIRVYAIGIEHGIMLARVLIMIITPVVPRWLAVRAPRTSARLSHAPGVAHALSTTAAQDARELLAYRCV
jgi:hypothetical protein